MFAAGWQRRHIPAVSPSKNSILCLIPYVIALILAKGVVRNNKEAGVTILFLEQLTFHAAQYRLLLIQFGIDLDAERVIQDGVGLDARAEA